MSENIFVRLKEGNESAYRIIFEDYYLLLVVFAHKYVHDLDLAKEIAQNAFVKLFEKRESLTITISVKAYLYKIVYNDCLNHIESKKRISEHLSIYAKEIQDDINCEKYIETTEREYKLHKAIEKLPEQCKLVFKLNRFEGKKNKDIAEELNISIRTVETHISKAIRLLKKHLNCFIHLFFW